MIPKELCKEVGKLLPADKPSNLFEGYEFEGYRESDEGDFQLTYRKKGTDLKVVLARSEDLRYWEARIMKGKDKEIPQNIIMEKFGVKGLHEPNEVTSGPELLMNQETDKLKGKKMEEAEIEIGRKAIKDFKKLIRRLEPSKVSEEDFEELK